MLQSFRHRLPAFVVKEANEAYTYSDKYTSQVNRTKNIKCNTKL